MRAPQARLGGMISPVAEGQAAETAFEGDCRSSRSLWPGFASDLERTTGEVVGLDMTGNVLVALDDQRARALERRAAVGDGELWRTGPEIEPALSTRISGVFVAGRDGVVDPRRTLFALAQALDTCGAKRIRARVERIAIDHGSATGVAVDGRVCGADAVVLAAGVWGSRLLAASGLERLVPSLEPVKGQMLSMRAPVQLRRVVRGQSHYLIPRGDLVVVGSTSEPGRFDAEITPEAIGALRQGAEALVPALASAEVVEAWAGLRPAFPSGLPLVGPSAIPGLFLALGHYRNGVLMAPLTAVRVANDILDGREAGDLGFRASGAGYK
ncbi:MAG: FAD-dependent oxidoreductase [Alphaproteobacteria bacterium]